MIKNLNSVECRVFCDVVTVKRFLPEHIGFVLVLPGAGEYIAVF